MIDWLTLGPLRDFLYGPYEFIFFCSVAVIVAALARGWWESR